MTDVSRDTIAVLGAGGFGALLGWLVYYINRYRKGDVQLGDLTSLVGVLGGGAVTSLFGEAKSVLFGAYGIGLFLGFFGYFVTLLILVGSSGGVFTWTWFLDGRRRRLAPDEEIQESGRRDAPMSLSVHPGAGGDALASAATRMAAAPVVLLPQAAAVPIDPKAARVVVTCEEKWEAGKHDCNVFVRSVAEALGIGGLAPPADAIVATITSGGGWRVLDDGPAARDAAAAGELVIAGLEGAAHQPPRAHGHVAVVVPGPLAQDRYPSAYWGSLEGTPYKNKTLNWAWRAADRDRIRYAARPI